MVKPQYTYFFEAAAGGLARAFERRCQINGWADSNQLFLVLFFGSFSDGAPVEKTEA